ncbi:MAG: aminopeptidase P family protein, partial [Solobacterium sp.]|nr:aminopeptidase P family protein [Solobacterium sp.]
MNVNEKIKRLRELMAENQIDIYYIPNEDDHLSQEYTAPYFQSKSFISGFTGEAGCVIVTDKFAGLWTDGRYFTQAEKELEGTCITLMRLKQEGIPDPLDYIMQNIPENGIIGFDGRVVSAEDALKLERACKVKHAKMRVKDDLVQKIWGKERPNMPKDEIYTLSEKYTGESVEKRVKRVRKAMTEKGADVLILTALEDPCWMLNIRGNDIACTPVMYSFAIVTEKKVNLFIDKAKVNEKVKEYLKNNNVTLKSYSSVSKELEKLHGMTIMADMSTLNTLFYTSIAADNRLLNMPSPVAMMRAVKNTTEIKNIRNAHVKDGVAMVRFIKWVKENVENGDMTELSAQNYLYGLRAEQKAYIEPSFHTICAYQDNGAMMHYSATEDSYAKIEPKGFLLVDSGGTYKDGTTDITRTISLSELSEEEKMYYTKVLKGHLQLARAKFLYGTCGNNLDILARGPMWDMDIDYQCGTGHGVGHVLSVHEGPHGIRWGMSNRGKPNVALEPGMVVTDEPGIYLPHEL